MAATCTLCERRFSSERALQQHIRDSATHATKLRHKEASGSPHTELPSQELIELLPTHTASVTDKRDQAKRQSRGNLPGRYAGRNHGSKATGSFSLRPMLHQDVVERLRASDLVFKFRHQDDHRDAMREYDTTVIGSFLCRNTSCSTFRWTSHHVAITIRLYLGHHYNARVYHQRCDSCHGLSSPRLDGSYADRVSYRLMKWSGVPVEAPPFSGKYTGPHQIDLCEGCKHGRCR